MQQCLAVNAWTVVAIGCLMPLIVLHRMELAARERLKLAHQEQLEQQEGAEERRQRQRLRQQQQEEQQQQVSAELALGSSHEQPMQAWSVGELLIQFYACSSLVWNAVCAVLVLLPAHLTDARPP